MRQYQKVSWLPLLNCQATQQELQARIKEVFTLKQLCWLVPEWMISDTAFFYTHNNLQLRIYNGTTIRTVTMNNNTVKVTHMTGPQYSIWQNKHQNYTSFPYFSAWTPQASLWGLQTGLISDCSMTSLAEPPFSSFRLQSPSNWLTEKSKSEICCLIFWHMNWHYVIHKIWLLPWVCQSFVSVKYLERAELEFWTFFQVEETTVDIYKVQQSNYWLSPAFIERVFYSVLMIFVLWITLFCQ